MYCSFFTNRKNVLKHTLLKNLSIIITNKNINEIINNTVKIVIYV